jgi:hypothetical protein
MIFDNNALEIFWDNMLSRDPDKILAVFKPLTQEDRRVVIEHLNRMLTEVGWHSEQRDSARAALKALEELFIEEERNRSHPS